MMFFIKYCSKMDIRIISLSDELNTHDRLFPERRTADTLDLINHGGLLKSVKRKSPVNLSTYRTLAEREGFEPPVPLSTPVFKTGAFDHSAISP